MNAFHATSPEDVLVGQGELEDRGTCLFEALACQPEAARIIARHLVGANLRGHDSHGVSLIPLYVRMVEEGKVDPSREVAIREVGPSILIADAFRSFGQVAAERTIERAIAAARQTGIVIVALRESHHVGRIGHYAEGCANAGLASVHFVNVIGAPPVVAPWGGSEARLHTNPIAIGFPREGAPPMVLDFATSRVAQGKMRIAMARGLRVPEGYLIDHEGRPSRDPAVAYGTADTPMGALLPFGTYKGFGLALMCELLAGALGGGRTLNPDTAAQGVYLNNMLSIVFDPARLDEAGSRDGEIDSLVAHVLGASPSEDGPVRLPGDRSLRCLAHRSAHGIPVDRETWDGLAAIFTRYRV